MSYARTLSIVVAILALFNLIDSATTPGRTQQIGFADAFVAGEVLPYAYMSEGAYDGRTSPAGWSIWGDWRTVFTAAGRADLINAAAKSGFNAEVYRGPNGDITIAYKGTTASLGDLSTDYRAWKAQTPDQFDQFSIAKELAILVKNKFQTSHIAVTGHSLGGALATYVGQQVPGISKVVTFNPANFGILSAATRAGTDQINIIVPRDWIGDPRVTSSPTGLGSLSGKTYSIDSTTTTPQSQLSIIEGKWDPYVVVSTHALSGIIGGLKNVVSAQTTSPVSSGTGATVETKPAATQIRSPPSSQAATPSSATPGSVSAGSVSPPAKVSSLPTNSQSPPTLSTSLVKSTNPNLQMYSFKPLANGNVEIYENGKPTSTGSGFARSYAQSLGYSPPLPQQTTSAPSSTSVPIISPSTQSVTPSATGAMSIGGGWAVRETKPNDERQWFLNGKYVGTEFLGPGGSINRSGSTVSEAEIRNAPAIAGQPGVQYVGGVLPTNNDFLKLSITPSAVASSTGTLKPQTMPSATSGSVPANAQSPVSPIVQRPQPNTQVAARATGPNASVSSPSISSAPAPTARGIAAAPGGISLSKAAAERMPLNLSIEGAFVKDGRIILSGHKNTEGSIDAALLLTALRATCEGRDPYFSLDPDDLSLWLKETEKGGDEFFAHIKKDTAWTVQKGATRGTPSILKFRTISASQNYPAYWSTILAKYPHLKSRLVFRPEWLRQTRFGEILYKADVLLKELTGGVSMLGAPQLRASKIDDYLSATQISSAKRLLYKYHNLPDRTTTIAGGRIWYDLSETSDVSAERPEGIPAVNSELRTLLQKRHLLPDNAASAILPVSLQQSEGSLDISNVFPRMYVRVRDPITLRDGAGNFPGVNELVNEANGSPPKYAAAYKEYRALVEVFRAYVVAVHARRMEPGLCAKLPKGLLDTERLPVALPEYHPTDLALTIGWFEYSDGRFRRAIGATGALFQGGVSVGATPLFSRIARNSSDTPVLRELKLESAKMHQEPTWAGDSGRQFVAFTFDEVTAQAVPPPNKFASVILKEGENYGPPVVPQTPRPASSPNERKSYEQRSTQWEPQGNKATQGFPNISSVAAGPRRAMKLEELLIPIAIILALLFILLRLVTGFSPARATSSASQGKAPQGSFVFAMPDLSSPDSVPYVPPWQKDRNWKTRATQTADSSPPQATVQPVSKTHTYDAVERDFKNVFAMKSRVDREQMILHWKNVHGGSREDAMRRLVEQWRHDNRDQS